MSRKFIINADDFGLCEGVNRAVFKAHTEGVLTSATIMTNTAGSDDAVKLSKSMPSLGVGIHLNLTEGIPITKNNQIKKLTGSSGEFALSPGKLFFLSMLNPKIKETIKSELEAQIQWLVERDIKPTHIDSHKHIHTIPAIFKIVIELAEKYDISAIRLPIEHSKFQRGYWPKSSKKGKVRSKIISSLAKFNKLQNSKYFKTDAFLGIAHTGQINLALFRAVSLRSSISVIEIMTHPGFTEGLDPAKTRLLQQREDELNTLCSEQVRLYFEKAGIELIHYGQL
ncbi:MAG TPA: ChbG/HpnK family deacetylase [Sedimentisphaerales bacterium]|nr:ChbG/HpnK family deacetylase [Sedimentisphaerales bacterium]